MRKGFCAVVLLGLVAAMAGSSAYAQMISRPQGTNAFDASAGNDTLQLYYATPSPLGAVNGDMDYGILLSKERDFIASAALLVNTGIRPIPRLHLQVGPQVYAAMLKNGNTDVFAISAGATASIDLIRSLGVTAFGSAFYAPGVLLFGDANRFYSFSAGATVRFVPSLYGMAGYRWMRFSLTAAPSERVQNEVFVGLRWVPGATEASAQ